jgi:ParB family protein of integrating conjugative element (PFGI_1 class)
MADLTSRDIAGQLLAERFERSGPNADALSDPIADTPLTVTLDQLQPYDLNPRVTRNPRYDDIKGSIRERGLDAPPVITRRPSEPHYIIRNGGNTRLAILNELWSETRDERFFRIPCLFRPWSERGEIIALTGHLAENELRGSLSFIEKALGVEKVRDLYEQECGQSLTQTELARRLSADGYPITQPHVSRMQDAIRYLLPAIPTVLYGGLGKPQIERLTALRKAGARIWEARAAHKMPAVDFSSLFHEVLATFDGAVNSFSLKRIQDELIGQMADLLQADYDSLTLEIGETENRQQVLSSEPAQYLTQSERSSFGKPNTSNSGSPSSNSEKDTNSKNSLAVTSTHSEPPSLPVQAPQSRNTREPLDERLDHGIVSSSAATTDRLQSIPNPIFDQAGDASPGIKNVPQTTSVEVDSLHPISDARGIDPDLDAPGRLRAHIAQLAREITEETEQAFHITPTDGGVGFICGQGASGSTQALSPTARAVLTLLHALSRNYSVPYAAATASDGVFLMDVLGPLLQGQNNHDSVQSITRLSDNALDKLFRLVRLARRLLELENNMETDKVSTDP